MITEEQMRIIIDALERNGIVTRNDCIAMDSRPLAKEADEELSRRGYTNLGFKEVALEGYKDYSGVIFDLDKFSYQEADEYMFKYVLEN